MRWPRVPGYEKATTALNRNGPAAFFNGMIAPLTPMTIKGACWYQGESNLGLRGKYVPLLHALIGDWRKHFDCGDIPFYVVQLVPFGNGRDGNQAELREAQASGLQLKKTGLVVTNDLAERGNIHRKNNRDVGRRPACQALRRTYGSKDVVADGPTFESCERRHAKIQITFRDIGGGLVSRDGKPLTCFEVAGADGKIVCATAVTEGDKVIVSAPIVSAPIVAEPKFAYFAWGDGDTPNLMSKDRLHAAQFRAKLTKPPMRSLTMMRPQALTGLRIPPCSASSHARTPKSIADFMRDRSAWMSNWPLRYVGDIQRGAPRLPTHSPATKDSQCRSRHEPEAPGRATRRGIDYCASGGSV
jgi:hypothetical protein